jgi:protease PrsW
MLYYSIIGAIFPMLMYLYFLWKFDKNEPEPIKFVLYHFFFGATAAIIIGVIGSKIASFPLVYLFNTETNNLLKVIIIAPIIEELAKASLLFKTIKNKNIDNLTDGLIYGGAIGLGFGMTENFLYFILYSDSFATFLPLFLIRSGFSAVMHSLSTATVGGLMSLTKYSSTNKSVIATISGLLIAIFIHFIWNLSVSFSETYLAGILFMVLIILFFILTYYFSLKFEIKLISKELATEIPEELLMYLTSVFKFKKGWFLRAYQNRFITKTTLLAFRKHQVDISEKNIELYAEEIEQLRTEISEMIKLNNNYKMNK